MEKNLKWWQCEAGRHSSNIFLNVYRVACAFNYNPVRDWVQQSTWFWARAMFTYNDNGCEELKKRRDIEILA